MKIFYLALVLVILAHESEQLSKDYYRYSPVCLGSLESPWFCDDVNHVMYQKPICKYIYKLKWKYDKIKNELEINFKLNNVNNNLDEADYAINVGLLFKNEWFNNTNRSNLVKFNELVNWFGYSNKTKISELSRNNFLFKEKIQDDSFINCSHIGFSLVDRKTGEEYLRKESFVEVCTGTSCNGNVRRRKSKRDLEEKVDAFFKEISEDVKVPIKMIKTQAIKGVDWLSKKLANYVGNESAEVLSYIVNNSFPTSGLSLVSNLSSLLLDNKLIAEEKNNIEYLNETKQDKEGGREKRSIVSDSKINFRKHGAGGTLKGLIKPMKQSNTKIYNPSDDRLFIDLGLATQNDTTVSSESWAIKESVINTTVVNIVDLTTSLSNIENDEVIDKNKQTIQYEVSSTSSTTSNVEVDSIDKTTSASKAASTTEAKAVSTTEENVESTTSDSTVNAEIVVSNTEKTTEEVEKIKEDDIQETTTESITVSITDGITEPLTTTVPKLDEAEKTSTQSTLLSTSSEEVIVDADETKITESTTESTTVQSSTESVPILDLNAGETSTVKLNISSVKVQASKLNSSIDTSGQSVVKSENILYEDEPKSSTISTSTVSVTEKLNVVSTESSAVDIHESTLPNTVTESTNVSSKDTSSTTTPALIVVSESSSTIKTPEPNTTEESTTEASTTTTTSTTSSTASSTTTISSSTSIPSTSSSTTIATTTTPVTSSTTTTTASSSTTTTSTTTSSSTTSTISSTTTVSSSSTSAPSTSSVVVDTTKKVISQNSTDAPFVTNTSITIDDENVKFEITNYTINNEKPTPVENSSSADQTKSYSLRLHIKGYKWNEKYQNVNSTESQDFMKKKILPLLFKYLNVTKDELNEVKLLRLFKPAGGAKTTN